MEEIRKAYKLLSQNLKGRDISQGTSKDGGTVLKRERKRVYWIDMSHEKD
jgi:hypothetical protein